MKACTKCKEMKALTDFYPQKGGKFGKVGECIPCRKERNRKWKKDNAGKVRMMVKYYDWMHPEQKAERNRKYRAKQRKNHS